ncbi:MAG: insulinase family protein [Lachnospiraceae bacterium]|nr:insulinase family protein [Lachnospiraceae bacterium]MBQ9341101.1 insulinase family protein [Lachnospiraceae bacterium]MBR0434620.1 insulinase family protein [Lachnospiraceae bacterium]
MLDLKKLPMYELVKEEELPGIHSKGVYLRHIKTGARVCLFENDDDNKVFCIGFRTPPENHTGVPHIIEHTVLCGSERFPSKDPFQELIKSSLQTFLNAMTYNDKTIYPVASMNDKDFQNLMEVYLDAVFKPNIYKHEEIFMQEGWHYEIENKEDPIVINGVVYSEMKGAFSSIDEHIDENINRNLFPDTTYSKCSGGDPLNIPELTREYYLDFHRRYYHPSNSYIYLYGKMDMTEKLLYIDREYLSNYEKLDIDSEIKLQKEFDAPHDVTAEYPIGVDDDPKDKTSYSYASLITDATFDPEMRVAFDAIDYILMNMPGAPLKQALLDNGLGNDVSGYFSTYKKQCSYLIFTKNAPENTADKFKKVIKDTLNDILKQGLNKKAIEAYLNRTEFSYREQDTGYTPKGLIVIDSSFETLLYDDDKPFTLNDLTAVFPALKEKLKNTRYFEELIEKYLIGNKHVVYLTLKPCPGMTAKQDEELAKKLADMKAKMSDAEIEELIKKTKALKKYQSEGSTPEDIAKIPVLKRSDLKEEPEPIVNEVKKVEGTDVLWHDIETNGIHYFSFMFDINGLPVRLYPYASLLKDVFALLDTDKHTYSELSSEIDFYTGGITASLGGFRMADEKKDDKFFISLKAKTLYGKMDKAVELMKEIVEGTKYESDKRMKEILAEAVSRMNEEIQAAGHRYSMGRAGSYSSKYEYIMEITSGIAYYDFLKDIVDNFDARKEELYKTLREVAGFVFDENKLIVQSGCRKEEFDKVGDLIKIMKPALKGTGKTYEKEEVKLEVKLEVKNEAFTSSSRVQYVACAGNYKDKGYEYDGALRVLLGAVNNDSLYINVRIKGGAYGVFMMADKLGRLAFGSYRDPHIKSTLKAYNEVPEFIENLDVDDDTMTKYVIGAMGKMDTPLSPLGKCEYSAAAYFRGTTIDEIRKERKEVINATLADLKKFAPMVRDVLKDNRICVIGNEGKIEEDKDIFKTIRKL